MHVGSAGAHASRAAFNPHRTPDGNRRVRMDAIVTLEKIEQ